MADNRSMETSLVYQGVGMLLLCVLFFAGWCVGCRRRPGSLDDLNAPLLSGESVDHRIDAVTREAEAGYVVCGCCEFENFKRFAYCTLCGEKLHKPSPLGEDDADTGDEGAASDYTPRKSVGSMTQQQLRARTRKEWTRKLDVEGNMFWYRKGGGVDPATAFGSSIATQQAGFAVRFETVEEGESRTSVSDESRPVSDAKARASMAKTKDASDEDEKLSITKKFGAQKLVLTEASTADPGMFPTGVHALSQSTTEQKKEAIDFVTSDFPTKYAHFVVTTASMIVPAEVEFLKLSVHREYMLEESVDHMVCIKEKNIRSFMRINFLDESGVDAGGVHREWFMLVNELLVNPTLRLFRCSNRSERAYYFNPRSREEVGEDHLLYYYATGRLVGRALLEGGIWGFHFARPLLKIMLGMPVSFSDVEYYDPETYKNLVWMLQNDGADALGLDFTVTERGEVAPDLSSESRDSLDSRSSESFLPRTQDGSVRVVDLVPGGRDIEVTDANKLEYVDRWFKHTLFESVGDQLHAFLRGVYEVVPPEMLMLFDPEEFDYVLCGTPEIDVDDWRENSTHSANLNNANVRRWFWEVVGDMPNEYRRRLLLFATGSSCVPLSGFRGLTSYDGRLCPFNLRGVAYTTTQYISSHACFNRLDLPLYRSKRELKTVLYATLETDLTGFTTA